jgi:mono/diheme cytochrome c family protein
MRSVGYRLLFVFVCLRFAMGAVMGVEAVASRIQGGPFTVEQAARGGQLYEQACEGCHGPDLAGGKVVPGIAGQAFANVWTGRSLADLFERLELSMPPDDPTSVSPDEMVDILAHILRVNGWAAGEDVLPADRKVLETLVFRMGGSAPSSR